MGQKGLADLFLLGVQPACETKGIQTRDDDQGLQPAETDQQGQAQLA